MSNIRTLDWIVLNALWFFFFVGNSMGSGIKDTWDENEGSLRGGVHVVGRAAWVLQPDTPGFRSWLCPLLVQIA